MVCIYLIELEFYLSVSIFLGPKVIFFSFFIFTRWFFRIFIFKNYSNNSVMFLLFFLQTSNCELITTSNWTVYYFYVLLLILDYELKFVLNSTIYSFYVPFNKFSRVIINKLCRIITRVFLPIFSRVKQLTSYMVTPFARCKRKTSTIPTYLKSR